MLLAKAEWGTVPDWVTAFGTLAAFAAALVLLRKELVAHRGYQEDRRRAQARLVAAWMTVKRSSDSERRSYVVMKNGSEEPVYDGLATVLVLPSDSASDPGTTFEQDRPDHAMWQFRWLLLPPHETKEAVLGVLPESWMSPWNAAIELSFTDGLGRRWTRLPDGTLTEVNKRPRRSRKDFYNAWIARELEDLDY